jgi:hypothetical protein
MYAVYFLDEFNIKFLLASKYIKFQYKNVFKLYVYPYYTVLACVMFYLNGIQANSTASTSRNTTGCN